MLFHFFPTATFERTWQCQYAIARSDQPRHGQPDRFEHASHFAVAAFADHHSVPFIHAFATTVGDFGKLRATVLEFYAGQQFLAHAFFQLAQRPYCILAVDAVARMHEAVCQVARGGEQQQAFRVEIEPTDCQPFTRLHGRQAVEYRWTAIRIVGADDFAGWLVVHQYARRPLTDLALN